MQGWNNFCFDNFLHNPFIMYVQTVPKLCVFVRFLHCAYVPAPVELTWELWSDTELHAFKDDPLDAPIGDNFNKLDQEYLSNHSFL